MPSVAKSTTTIHLDGGLAHWRAHARRFVAEHVRPSEVVWSDLRLASATPLFGDGGGGAGTGARGGVAGKAKSRSAAGTAGRPASWRPRILGPAGNRARPHLGPT